MCLNTRSWVFDVLHTKPYKIFNTLFKILNARSMQLDRLWCTFIFVSMVNFEWVQKSILTVLKCPFKFFFCALFCVRRR